MTPECLNDFSFSPHALDDLHDVFEDSFLASALGTSGKPGDVSQQGRQRPRGGKKPLRPRQQQLNALEAEYERKLSEFKAAQQEREKLLQRIKVLEAVLPVREQQLQLLKQRRQAPAVRPSPLTGDDFSLQPALLRIRELHGSGSSGGLSSSSDTQQTSEDAAECAGGNPRPPALVRALRASVDYAKVVSHADTYTSGKTSMFSAIPAHSLTPAHVQRQLINFWKQWVRECGLVLHACDARPHDPSPQQTCVQLYEQLGRTLHPIRLEYPFFLVDLMHVNLETGEREVPSETYWMAVAQGLRLSPEQVADAMAVLGLYSERTGRLLEERRQLLDQVETKFCMLHGTRALPVPAAAQTAAPATCGQLMLQLDDVVAQLYRNVLMQAGMHEVLKDFTDSKLLSLVQIMRVSVLSYPYLPDIIAVFSCLATVTPCLAKQQ